MLSGRFLQTVISRESAGRTVKYGLGVPFERCAVPWIGSTID